MADPASETPVAAPPPAPELKLVFTSHIDADIGTPRFIKVGTGTRTNITVQGGHWNLPDGTVFANVVPGLGGEFGIIDNKKVFHLDIKYTVEFDDGKFGYVSATGHGVAGVSSILSVNLETDSEKYSYLAGKVILSPGVFIGSTLVASFFLPKEHWVK